jgi:hypothetical protein
MSPVTRTSLFWVIRARMRNSLSAAKYFVVSPQLLRITPGALKLVAKLKTVAPVTLLGAWS